MALLSQLLLLLFVPFQFDYTLLNQYGIRQLGRCVGVSRPFCVDLYAVPNSSVERKQTG